MRIRDDDAMTERDEQAKLHDEENRAEFAIRREEAAMADDERRLEREMEDYDKREEEAKRHIEAELRKEHWGHEPERRPSWEEEQPHSDQ